VAESLIMRALTLVAAALAFVLPLRLIVPLRAGSEGAPLKSTAQKAPAKVDAPEVYKINCLACHGPDGNMPAPLSFADNEWKHGNRLQDVTKVISDGIEGTAMLPFKEKLTKAEIAALAKLVRSFDKTLSASKSKSAAKPVKSHD
jgi:mono/diheme cytochrome c family protein